MADGKGIAGIVSCWGYGYTVKMLVNGIDIGVSGGKSESKRLFSRDHEMYAEAPPEIRGRLFILKEGANEIEVEFTKSSRKESDYLQISIELEGYPAPVFLLHSRSKASEKMMRSVTMQAKSPGDLKPAFISDLGENKLAFVHVGTMNCTVTPVLNGKEGMALAGMPGQVVLENVKEGENELSVRYGGPLAEVLEFAVITPEWVKYLVRKISSDEEKTETFPFNSSGSKPASAAGSSLEKLKSPDSVQRLLAVGALRDAGEKGEDISYAKEALVAVLSDKDKDTRESTALVLTYFYGRRKEWKEIDALLANRYANVKCSALYGLGSFVGSFPLVEIPNLLKSPDDADYDVRAAAAGFFEKAAAKGMDISPVLPGLRSMAIYGDERMKEKVGNAIKSFELGKQPGKRCKDCLDCETGIVPGNDSKTLEDMAFIIKSISCCAGDVTHRVFRCSTCGKHYLSTYFDHSDSGHGQFSISIISKEDAERIAAMLKKCPDPESKLCGCEVHMGYLKDERVPIKGELKYSFEDKD